MSQFGWDDCAAPVRSQVETLVGAVKQHLGENLVGVYLHGSLAAGCFNPDRSDLDLLVITKEKMSVETKRCLAQLHLDISCKPCPIEIHFLTLGDLNPWRHPTPYDFHYSEDWRERFQDALATESWRRWNDKQEIDEDLAGHITIARKRGLCLLGPSIEDVFPEVPARDYAASIVADIERARERIKKHPVYTVLNHCRVYAYLRAGLICTKDEGAHWALGAVPRRYHKLIAAALDAHRGKRGDTDVDLDAAKEFTRYIAQRVAELQDTQGLETD